jgi:hypothetical protein
MSGISREVVLQIVETWRARQAQYFTKAIKACWGPEAIGHSAMAVTFEWAATELLANMEPESASPPAPRIIHASDTKLHERSPASAGLFRLRGWRGARKARGR